MAADLVTKRAPSRLRGQPLYEAAGLRWLEEGGARVARVVHVSPDALSTVRIPSAAPSPEAARQLGGMLAAMHGAGAPYFGAPPPGYDGRGWIGKAPLTFPDRSIGWGQFYAQFRIRPYLSRVFTKHERAVIEDLCAVLESGALDHPQPQLLRTSGQQVARLHGDLWSGNVLWSPEGCVLIDPAAQGGHAETDLATLHTFGVPFLDQIIEGYQQVSPLTPGWRQRVGLHQMHILMVHSYLFGGSYVPQTVQTAATLLL